MKKINIKNDNLKLFIGRQNFDKYNNNVLFYYPISLEDKINIRICNILTDEIIKKKTNKKGFVLELNLFDNLSYFNDEEEFCFEEILLVN